MNKKGFTLVEVLAVIVILAIIMLIAAPNIFDALNAGKNKISEIEKKHIVDASETLVMEIMDCDITVKYFNKIFSKSISKCSEMKDLALASSGLKTTIARLKKYQYFNDSGNKCSGTIIIKTDSNYKVTVDTSKVTCS